MIQHAERCLNKSQQKKWYDSFKKYYTCELFEQKRIFSKKRFSYNLKSEPVVIEVYKLTWGDKKVKKLNNVNINYVSPLDKGCLIVYNKNKSKSKV